LSDCQGIFLPILTNEVSFVLTEGFDLGSVFVDHPSDDLDGFVVSVNERVVATTNVRAVRRIVTEGFNATNERHVLVVEPTHAGQVVQAVDVSFSQCVYVFHVYKIPQITENTRDFFTIMQIIFVDDFSNVRFIS